MDIWQITFSSFSPSLPITHSLHMYFCLAVLVNSSSSSYFLMSCSTGLPNKIRRKKRKIPFHLPTCHRIALFTCTYLWQPGQHFITTIIYCHNYQWILCNRYAQVLEALVTLYEVKQQLLHNSLILKPQEVTMWKLIWTCTLWLGCIFAVGQLDTTAGMYLCVYIRSECDERMMVIIRLCVFMFQRKLNGFPRSWTQISARKDCFECLWKSLEAKNTCQDISVMFFCPVEYAFAIKKQCSKPSRTISNTTNSEVRHYCNTITINTVKIAYILNNSV